MNILYYNGNLLYDKNNLSLLKKLDFIKENISEEYINLFKDSNFFANKSACLVDRTEANPFFISLLSSKIPKEKNNTHLSFKQLCEKRSLELLHIGKRINIMWSGGIDSTTVLFSLINKVNDLSQLRVLLTPDSILESGNLFDLHIKDKVPFILETKVAKKCYFYKDEFDNFKIEREIITSGCLSDHLNSILRLNIPYDEKYWHFNYEEILMQHTNKNVIDFLNKSVKAFPKEIKTYIDFLKFYGFNFHWHKEKYFPLVELDSKYFPCFNHFFDTYDFQNWSMWNKESDITPGVLKKPQRDLLYELTGDKLYSYGKNKGMSGPGVYTNNDWMFLLENGKTIKQYDLTSSNNYDTLI